MCPESAGASPLGHLNTKKSMHACADNSTNWDVAGGNIILVVLNGPSVPVAGDSGGSGYGTTDLNANFRY